MLFSLLFSLKLLTYIYSSQSLRPKSGMRPSTILLPPLDRSFNCALRSQYQLYCTALWLSKIARHAYTCFDLYIIGYNSYLIYNIQNQTLTSFRGQTVLSCCQWVRVTVAPQGSMIHSVGTFLKLSSGVESLHLLGSTVSIG